MLGQRKIEWGWFRFKEDNSKWAVDDPRWCRRCPEKSQTILGFANYHCEFWKCNNCGTKTAERWGHCHATWSREQIIQSTGNCSCRFHQNLSMGVLGEFEGVVSPDLYQDISICGMAREVEWCSYNHSNGRAAQG